MAVNNRANATVRFEDLNVNKMVFATAKTWVSDLTGQNLNVYEIWYQETNSLTLSTYLFPRTAGQNVGTLKTILNAWSSANNMVQYFNWIELNRRPIGTAKDILLNDDFIVRRIYLTVDGGVTDIYVGVRQALDDEIFRVTGDQTKAQTYYYDYSWSG